MTPLLAFKRNLMKQTILKSNKKQVYPFQKTVENNALITSFSFNFSLTFLSVVINSVVWLLWDISNSDILVSNIC